MNGEALIFLNSDIQSDEEGKEYTKQISRFVSAGLERLDPCFVLRRVLL